MERLMESELQRNGHHTINGLYGHQEMEAISSLIQAYTAQTGSGPYAIRELLYKIPGLCPIIFGEKLLGIVRQIDAHAFVCKSIYFDKTPQTNWYVNWHQDISIHVSDRIETDGFYGWTQKGIIGVCAPDEVLRNMFTVRIHLDDVKTCNGALKVVPGTHHKTLLPDEIREICIQNHHVCELYAGGIHIMKPLLLHSSSKSTASVPRRVIHLEFTSADLPNGLQWAEKLRLAQ